MSEEQTELVVAEPEETEETVATPTSITDIKRKMKLTGEVTRLELYGAFIDIGIDVNALIHISQMGEGGVNRVSDALSVGDKVDVWVDKVDVERKQVMVTMKEPLAVEWADLKKGQAYEGTITRLETFGAFVSIGAEREGLVHISELSHDYVRNPSEVVSVGDDVQVEVLNFSRKKRRIDLSMKALMAKPDNAPPDQATKADFEAYAEEVEEEMPSAMELALRKAISQSDSDIDMPAKSKKKTKRSKRRIRKQQEELLNRTLARQEN